MASRGQLVRQVNNRELNSGVEFGVYLWKINPYFLLILLLTVSVPHDFRLVFFHSGINNDSATQTQCLPFTAKSNIKFVDDGCLKGNTVFRAETIWGQRGQISLKFPLFTLSLILFFHLK